MPLRHKDTKVHKELITNALIFVRLCVLVSLWQKKPRTRSKDTSDYKDVDSTPLFKNSIRLSAVGLNPVFTYEPETAFATSKD
jgi:hypothetical protein